MSRDDFLIDYEKILGQGDYGIVYKGTFEEENVAVKRTPLFNVKYLITKDEFLLRIRHVNVVKILHITKDEDFRFTYMELCAASLDHRMLGKYNGPMPSNEQVLLQLANGLGYLHSLNVMHGDIKPENILISSTLPVQMKWTGFGFRQLNGSFSLSLSGPQLESRRWWPPEMYLDQRNASEKGEIFSAGCVFFYFLSNGVHPFGTLERGGESQIVRNVQEGNPVNMKDLSQTNFHFVESMIVKNTMERIPLWEVINFLEIKQRQSLESPFQLSSLQYVEKGYFNGYFSCGLFLSKSNGFAVKRIPIQYCTSYGDLKQFSISNIVRILHFEPIGPDLFYGMEFCDASLDHCFPTKERGKIYQGPMPSHEQIFFQLVTGLQYIHEKGLVHGSIKPSNILIYSENDPQIKLSDFGLTFPRWNDKISSTDNTGFQSDHYWMASELHKIFEKFERKHSPSIFKPTVASDIFAVGKIFFYYYFQTYSDVIHNVWPAKNAFKKLPMLGFCKIRNDHYPMQLYTEMFEKESRSQLELKYVIDRVISYQLTSKGELNRPKVHNASGNIQFSRDHILGKGGQAVVHLGLWKDSIAAIKRINTRIHGSSPEACPEVIKELGVMQRLNHFNIIKFFGYEKDNDFIYIAIEKCLISLHTYCRQLHLYQGVIPMRPNKEVLLQLARGLQYIHSQHLIHGDVKPGNILISTDNPANLKFADFGLSIQKDEMENKIETDWSFVQGTEGWMAPELIINYKITEHVIDGQKCDIFALGCVFFFFLVPAFHPFGNNKAERRKNILSGDPINLIKLSAQTSAFKVIIQGMIERNPDKRSEIDVNVIRKLGEVTQSDIEILTEASSRLSVSDDQPNPKRQKY